MAKIADLLAAGRTYSFEFFPPKNDAEQAVLVRALRELEPLAPSFVSVTYRGGRASRRRTTDLVVGMLRTTILTPMAHLTCVAHTRLELAEYDPDLFKLIDEVFKQSPWRYERYDKRHPKSDQAPAPR